LIVSKGDIVAFRETTFQLSTINGTLPVASGATETLEASKQKTFNSAGSYMVQGTVYARWVDGEGNPTGELHQVGIRKHFFSVQDD
jgi:hypothetical protein